jgi:hypothetical protein
VGSKTTLGDGAPTGGKGDSTTGGKGESTNVRRRGVTDSCGLRTAETGERAGAGERVCKEDVGVATLGESWLGTLGRPGRCD